MSEVGDGSDKRRGRGTVDRDSAPVALWLGAIVALVVAIAAGSWVLGRGDSAPPSQGPALTIGDAETALLTPEDVGAGATERVEDADDTAVDLVDLLDGATDTGCAERLRSAGAVAWDPLAPEGDPLARRVVVVGGGSLSQDISPHSEGSLDDVRDAVEACPELTLEGDQGDASARLTVVEPTGEAAAVGDDQVAVEAVITGPDGAERTVRATTWLRDDLAAVVAVSSAPGQAALPVDDAAVVRIVSLADDRLGDALDRVS